MAGRIASPLRNRIATERIDNLVCIAKNYSLTDLNKEGEVRSIISVEEFSDYLVNQEDVLFEAHGEHDDKIIHLERIVAD